MQDVGSQRRVHISTRTFPDEKRLAMWQEMYGRGIANVDIEPIGEAPFHADVTFNLLPNVSIAAGSRSPAHYRVTQELSNRVATSSRSAYCAAATLPPPNSARN